MGWLLDRLVLKNSRHPLTAEGAVRRWIQMKDQRIECFTWSAHARRTGPSASDDLQIIKFVGAAGRAENVSLHPFDAWTDLCGAVTAANPPGFGQSPGRARLDTIVGWALHTFDTIAVENPGAPILLTGNSLGATVAMCVAAARQRSAAKGLILRDAPQIKQIIWRRFGWQSAWLPALWSMRRVPVSLDAVAAARSCSLPAIIVSSGRDRVVPPDVQRMIIDAYQGPMRLIRLTKAGHYDPMSPGELEEYEAALAWLRQLVVGT
jgi:pimeloyl-ACP methyl ester carboxylesterase